jgi:gas vesicle protein
MGEDPNAIRADIERTRAEMGDTVDALGYKTDVKSRAKDRMDRITGRVSNAAPDGRQVKRAASAAQENPLGLAVGGVAAGFLLGLLVPSSRVEDEKLGPMADQVKDQIKETGQEALDRGKDVAQQAAETAKEAGREHTEEMRGSTQERAQSVSPS